MPYDKSLDDQLFSKAWESEEGRLSVSVFSYNNGPRKLQIVRETRDAEGNFRFGKMGRLTKEEAEGVLPLIQEAIAQL